MLAFLVLLFLALALGGYLTGVYNGLVRVRAAVKLTWSDIDVLLAQRHDELPKLVEVCKQYMQYEGGTLERVMRARAGVDAARSSGSMSSLGTAERELPAAESQRAVPAPAGAHQRPRDRHRRPARAVQRRGQHQQRAYRQLPRSADRRHGRFSARAAAAFRDQSEGGRRSQGGLLRLTSRAHCGP
jgi:hypothetical protein